MFLGISSFFLFLCLIYVTLVITLLLLLHIFLLILLLQVLFRNQVGEISKQGIQVHGLPLFITLNDE